MKFNEKSARHKSGQRILFWKKSRPRMPTVLAQLPALERCPVCALPLPRNVSEGTCSRRCAGLRPLSLAINGPQETHWRAAILERLGALRPGTTICPGELAVDLLPEIDKPLTVLRPLLYQLAEEGRVVLSQQKRTIPWWKIRGPFRIRRK